MHRNKAGFFAHCIGLYVMCCFNTTAYADNWTDNFYFNGYASLDMTLADSNIATVSSAGEMRFYENDKLSLKNSLLGGQIEYKFSDNLSLYAQGVAFYDKDDKASTDINWAYLSYDLGYDINFRAGVFQTPFLQGTELRSVGYSRLWARPLTPGAGASGINQYRGLDIIKQYAAGQYNWEFQLALGRGEHDLAKEVDVGNLQLLSAKVLHEQFWLRAAIMRANYSVTTPRGQRIIDDGEVLMASLETEVTFEQVVINAGYSTSDSEVTPNDTMHYLSLAYRLDEVTPYILLAKRNQFFEAFTIPALPNRPPPPPTPDGNADMYSTGAGLRWDFAEHLAVKFQLENIRATDDSGRRNSVPKAEGNVLSLVIEGAF